ncbi:VOC family protein [Brevibacillus choshinensis]|uniref:VOC family protein n=1 Tax=Brevibacillus choshinensis TaxID=54911 RepID=UPI002E22A247|nr:VOC family protein [Brevibacillus choshinensis]MED4753309.1 VOC family protein [Brevibacillus choshinensis]MED4782265.1 VOC family protein [Brevibacillus choshinensis]
MSANITNFAVVQLPVKDVEASVKWYREVLGIPFTFDFKPGDNEAWMNVGGVGLGLVRSENVPNLDFRNMQGQLQPIISLQVQNIQAVYQELAEKGYELGEMVYKQDGGYSFQLRDPDGHLSNLWGGWPSA